MAPITKDELEELIVELEQHRGRATELITVYIPSGQNIYTVAGQLEAEKGTAKNIKSTSTRKNVTDSLDKISRELKNYKKTPDNGLALFCGNVSKVEGQSDLQVWNFEPPEELKMRLYRCDKEFVLNPLKEMTEIKEVYGLVVMDRKEATIGVLEGKRIEVLHKMSSGVPSKVRAGGQCLSEDTIVNEKNRGEIKLKEVNVGDILEGINLKTMSKSFYKCKKKWNVNKKSLLIITNGDYPSSHINASLDHLFYIYEKNNINEKLASKLKEGDLLIGRDNKLIKILFIDRVGGEGNLIDIEVENHNFLANGLLVHNSSQRFHRITEGLTKDFYKRIAEEMKKCFFDNQKLKGIIVGGPIPTKDEWVDGEYLVTNLRTKIIGVIDIGDTDESGLKELVEKSKEILSKQEIMKEKKLLVNFFNQLGGNRDMTAYDIEPVKKALENGAVETLILSKKLDKEIFKELKMRAENISSKIEIVSNDTEEGEQFWNITRGVGAILRYVVH